jgi:hypothetical protein
MVVVVGGSVVGDTTVVEVVEVDRVVLTARSRFPQAAPRTTIATVMTKRPIRRRGVGTRASLATG